MRLFIPPKPDSFFVAERFVSRAATTMVNGQLIFRVVGGSIKIADLRSECVTANDATASTLQYSHDPDVGSPVTISGASASLANAAAGTCAVLNMTLLSTAPDLVVTGTGLGGVQTRGIILPPGTLSMVIGVGSTTGTWRHHIRFLPLQETADVAPA